MPGLIELPDRTKAFDYENAFYLSCDTSRLAKVLAASELFRMTAELPGALVECGVFKGASLSRFALLRSLFGGERSRRMIGFDTFGDYPDAQYAEDFPVRREFVESAGSRSISADVLDACLQARGIGTGIELVAGDINFTVPAYVQSHPELRISLLNLDTDLYEPAVTVLEHLYPRVVPGGVLILDDYGVFPGETRAVEEYFRGRVRIHKFAFAKTPCYVVKE